MDVIKDHSNLIGNVSGERVVIKDLGRKLESPKGGTRHYVLVRCSCGDESEVQYRRFYTSSSCSSCAGKRVITTHHTSHAMTNTRVYKIWSGMKTRVSNPNREKYAIYGGRGISVCERWNKFENFYEDMGEPPSNKHTLDRIDVNGDYSPDNCRWATPSRQARNRQTTKLYHGMCLMDWVDSIGCPYSFARYHIAKKGKSPSDVKSLWASRQEGN